MDEPRQHIAISTNIHTDLKIQAAKEHITIKALVTKLVNEYLWQNTEVTDGLIEGEVQEMLQAQISRLAEVYHLELREKRG